MNEFSLQPNCIYSLANIIEFCCVTVGIIPRCFQYCKSVEQEFNVVGIFTLHAPSLFNCCTNFNPPKPIYVTPSICPISTSIYFFVIFVLFVILLSLPSSSTTLVVVVVVFFVLTTMLAYWIKHCIARRSASDEALSNISNSSCV